MSIPYDVINIAPLTTLKSVEMRKNFSQSLIFL